MERVATATPPIGGGFNIFQITLLEVAYTKFLFLLPNLRNIFAI
jgi:hypothetical protein